jgi:Secretion system C-terminal sorting domain
LRERKSCFLNPILNIKDSSAIFLINFMCHFGEGGKLKRLVLLLVLFLCSIGHLFSQTQDQLELVINEIDYDQISADNQEYLEISGIINTSLDNILIAFINGANGNEYGTIIDLTGYNIPNSSAQVLGGDNNYWDFFVIGASSVTNVNYTPSGWGSNQIQNGAPDGILLIYDSNTNGVFDYGTDIIIDAVAYENGSGGGSFDSYFGTTRTPSDNNIDANSSIGRFGTELDTDDNSLDFEYSGANNGTPGNINLDQLNSAFPVELNSFTASILNKSIKLNWKTETEVQNYGFEIERSVTPQDIYPNIAEFRKIDFIPGYGNSNIPHEYSYIDKDLKISGKYIYRLKQIDADGKYEYSDPVDLVFTNGSGYQLEQNYPNPFNPVTTISFIIPQKSFVSLKVYDVLGNEIETLVSKELEGGEHTVNFSPGNLPSALYIYSINAGEFKEVKKMLYLK